MSPRRLLGLASASLLLSFMTSGPEAARADQVGQVPLVVDLHVDLSYEHNYEGKAFAEGTGQYPARSLAAAGVGGVVLPLFVPHRVSPEGPRAEDLEASYQRVFAELARTPPYSLPGCNAAPGQVRTWLAFEGSAPLAGDREAVLRWVMRGVRLFGLVHTRSNRVASSSNEATPSYGLTAAGRELVKNVHQAGGTIDISHASDRAAREVLALAREQRRPVVATHSNARRLADHPRNLSDELLREVARSGGLVGVNFHSPFLARGRKAKLDDVVLHVRHMVSIMGIDHVGLGSDFEGDIEPPPGLEDVQGFARLAAALEQAGFKPAEVAKIFGGNALGLLCPAQPLGGALGR